MQAGVRYMKAIFLGTGTSCGVPIIGCDCRVCTSSDTRNYRRRSSLYVEAADTHVVIDTTPDFRDQVLTFGVPRVDALLYTHAHADHVLGLDDIRRFNTMQGGTVPAYGSASTIDDLMRIFDYVNRQEVPGVYRPKVDFISVDSSFSCGGFNIEPLSVTHGVTPTFGYLMEAEGHSVGYIPDCSTMSDETVARLQGIDLMILDGLRHKPHETHLTVNESVGFLERISAGRSYITHMTHDLDHEETESTMPDGIQVAYDGLVVNL